MKDYCSICGLPINGGIRHHPECVDEEINKASAELEKKAISSIEENK